MFTQSEVLNLLQKYNNTPRQIIKQNLKETRTKHKFKNMHIVNQLNFKKNKVNGWFNKSNPVVPTFEDALILAETFKFDITELIK